MSKLKTNSTAYKQTPFGLIPNEWEVKKISEFGKVYTGNTPDTTDRDNYGNQYMFVSPFDLGSNKYILCTEKMLSKKGFSKSRQFPKGSVLFTCIGSTIGKSGIAIEPLTSNQQINAIVVHESFSNEFLYYELENNCLRIKLLAGEQAVPIINKSQFECINLRFPPLPEQQKIATILSTWDVAIDHCKNIIENLKARNKGLAQNLLTGKIRVKGFEKTKWVERKADKIFKSHTDKTHEGNLEILSATQDRGVIPRSMSNYDIKYDESSLGTYKKVEVGDYVISLRSFQGGIEYSEYEGIVSPAYTILKEIIPISKTFYKVYFKTETFINRLNTIIYGIRDGKQISFGDFATLNLPYPSIEEQEAIAKILNTATSELNQYQQKLAQLQLQKKGLMQQLLTGKVLTIRK